MRSQSWLRLARHLRSIAAIGAAAVAILSTPTTAATTQSRRFFGSGLGAIPDGTGACPTHPGTPLNVTFNVTGLTGTVTSVRVTFNAAHSYVADLDVLLIAPNAANARLFGGTGIYNGSTPCGDGSDLDSSLAYTFMDSVQDPIGGGWWQAANVVADNAAVPGGVYRATSLGTSAGPNPAANVQMNAEFNGVAPNGTWTLRFVDKGIQDTGVVTFAALDIATTTTAGTRRVDHDGDDLTDFTVVRAVGGQDEWYTLNSQGFSAVTWGNAATDVRLSGDFDGDGKSDPAIWRTGSPGTFWVKGSGGSVIAMPWGLPGDDPSVVGDYDGDGKTDFAVYRCPVTPAGPCYYYVRRSSDGSLQALQWGFGVQGSYFPAVGDYDGDGRTDFAVQTANPSNTLQGIFYLMQSTAGFASVVWGLSGDLVIPGDYDGDGRSDIAVRRNPGGSQQYWILRSSDGGTTFAQWGLNGDYSAPGDYDGDGRTDIAAWRDSLTPGQSAFYIRRSNDLSLQVLQWGQHLDFPVAAFQVH